MRARIIFEIPKKKLVLKKTSGKVTQGSGPGGWHVSYFSLSTDPPHPKTPHTYCTDQGNSLGTFAGFKTRTSWFTGLGKNKKKWDSGFSYSSPRATFLLTEEKASHVREPLKRVH